MTQIVGRTEHGDTIFVSNPTHAAKAAILWATLTHGIAEHSMETMQDGCVKVEIPGLTCITFAPENLTEI